MTDSDVPTHEQMQELAKQFLVDQPPGSTHSVGTHSHSSGVTRQLAILVEGNIGGSGPWEKLAETMVDLEGTKVKVDFWRRVPQS